MNISYPEKRLKKDPLNSKATYEQEVQEVERAKQGNHGDNELDYENMYRCTPLILFVRQVLASEVVMEKHTYALLERNI
jgi:hypothetical protein